MAVGSESDYRCTASQTRARVHLRQARQGSGTWKVWPSVLDLALWRTTLNCQRRWHRHLPPPLIHCCRHRQGPAEHQQHSRAGHQVAIAWHLAQPSNCMSQHGLVVLPSSTGVHDAVQRSAVYLISTNITIVQSFGQPQMSPDTHRRSPLLAARCPGCSCRPRGISGRLPQGALRSRQGGTGGAAADVEHAGGGEQGHQGAVLAEQGHAGQAMHPGYGGWHAWVGLRPVNHINIRRWAAETMDKGCALATGDKAREMASSRTTLGFCSEADVHIATMCMDRIK